MNENIIDFSILDEYTPELTRKLLALFQEQVPQTVSKIKNHAATGNAASLAKEAHFLKGSSVSLGAVQLADLCKQVQQRGDKNDLGGVDRLIEQLEQSYARSLEVLQKRT
ncbi:MAG: Hpt domain-containing protein [Gammaproteobacteria bacterium]|nr:Hpt domain-containing protein [Gammaproteobacteria bacterium]